MKRLLGILTAVLCLALAPAVAFAAAEPVTNSSGSVFACGCPIKIVAGTTEGYTNVLWDKDGDGVIEDDEYLKIGSADPTAAGYDMSSSNVYGASKSAFFDSTSITMTGGTVANVFGGGNNTAMTGNATVVISGGTVKGVYGGGAGASSVVTGNTSVTITGGYITGASAGASLGSITGTRTIEISGAPEIGTLRLEIGDSLTILGGMFDEIYGDATPLPAPGVNYYEYDKSSATIGNAVADFAAAKTYAGEDLDDKWIIAKMPEYKVTYSAPDATSGTVPTDSVSYLGGSTATALGGDIARTGYTFDGWNTSADGSGDGYDVGDSIEITADVTLYAQWNPITYYVHFDANGGSGDMADQAFAYDESKALDLNAFSKVGHSFIGWVDSSNTPYADGATVGNLTSTKNAIVPLYAQWDPNSYAVTFDTDGGSDVASQTVEYGKTANEPEEPTKSGYAFGGWYADADLTTEYDFSTAITAPVTIYAKWNVICHPIIPQPCPLDDYDDLNRNAWYHDGVHWAIERGVMTGTGEAVWEPESTTTRAMVAMVLYRMEGEPNKTGEGAWYADAMAWAVKRGIFNGYGNDPSNLGENDPITREQLAVVLWRYEGYPSATADLSAYPDAGEVSAWAVDAMRWAVSEGIITGRGGTLLAPGGETERAEFATMMWRTR